MRVEITILPATIRFIILRVSSLLPENTRIKLYETISTNCFLQRMHCLLKHKILQFVFKCFT
jgi:hypothetical protein